MRAGVVLLALCAAGCQTHHAGPITASTTSPATGEFAAVAEANEAAIQDAKPKRYFLFVSRPNAKAWTMMKDNPQDRQEATAGAMRKIGCEMLAYYWGLGDGRNYIIVSAPDNYTVQTLIVQRLASGLMHEYEATELMRSADLVPMFERLQQIEAADGTLQKK